VLVLAARFADVLPVLLALVLSGVLAWPGRTSHEAAVPPPPAAHAPSAVHERGRDDRQERRSQLSAQLELLRKLEAEKQRQRQRQRQREETVRRARARGWRCTLGFPQRVPPVCLANAISSACERAL